MQKTKRRRRIKRSGGGTRVFGLNGDFQRAMGWKEPKGNNAIKIDPDKAMMMANQRKHNQNKIYISPPPVNIIPALHNREPDRGNYLFGRNGETKIDPPPPPAKLDASPRERSNQIEKINSSKSIELHVNPASIQRVFNDSRNIILTLAPPKLLPRIKEEISQKIMIQNISPEEKVRIYMRYANACKDFNKAYYDCFALAKSERYGFDKIVTRLKKISEDNQNISALKYLRLCTKKLNEYIHRLNSEYGFENDQTIVRTK
jgi:hypothetical protein